MYYELHLQTIYVLPFNFFHYRCGYAVLIIVVEASNATNIFYPTGHLTAKKLLGDNNF
jgi:hypothetical protein